MANKPKRQPDAARRAKLTIQRRTLYLLLVFGVFSFIALFFKVYSLTINQHEDLQKRAAGQQTLSTTISASRGTIYDREGHPLAMSATADDVFIDAKAIQRRADELDKKREEIMARGLKEGEKLPVSGQEYKEIIADNLARILEMDKEYILKRMEKVEWQYDVLKHRVEKDIGDQVRAFIAENETGSRIQGVHLQPNAKRYYAKGSLASHILGFLDDQNHGAYGLEAIYDEALDGSTGLMVTAKDANNREIMFQYEQYYDAENGHDLQLTIDSTVQYMVERGLEDMVAKYGAKNGATGIVIDVNSGALLALASNPAYDTNSPRTVYDPVLQQQLTALEEQEKAAAGAAPETTAAEDGEAETESEEESGEKSDAYVDLLGKLQLQQWRNKAVNDTYEPGSTYKIITLATALEEGTVNLNSTFDCTGSLKVDGWTLRCSKRAGHGHQTLTEAVGNSCNPAFMNIAFSVGEETYYKYMGDFGLFEKTGVDLQGEETGVRIKESDFKRIDLASYSFGQNFTVTPLALIAAQAACVNGGYLYTPYVVEKELDGDGNVVYQHDATPVRQVVSEETSATVRQILEYVVTDGTGKNGQVAGYRIGGKTGTADKANTKTPENPKGDIVVSFLAFAPADDPQIMMLLTLDTPARDTGTYPSGGNMVAPTASAILADILPYLGIAPQYTDEDAAAVEATVPYVVGLSEAEAAAKLKEYGFTAYRTVGNGDMVTDQTPLGGAIIPVGAEVILYMGAEKSNEPCTVPNVMGLTAAQANKKLVDAGLIMKATGASGDNKGVKVISQSMAEGTQVAAGTVITIQMGQTSATAD